jgi:DNA-binding response OmpR family regulator
MRLLLVEDDAKIAFFVTQGLKVMSFAKSDFTAA